MTTADKQPVVRVSGKQRRSSEQLVAVATVVLVAAIAAMLNYVAFRRYERFDMTSVGMFTLSSKSKQVLRELNDDVDIYLFLSRGESSFDQIDELLKRIQASSSHVHVHYVDPEREEAEFRLLAQKFGILAAVGESGDVMADVAAVVARGDKRWHINRDDLIGIDMGPGADEDEVTLDMRAEQALTGALVQVESGRATKLCLTQGHGEWSVEQDDERALSTFKFSLRHDNIEWQGFETLGQTKAPDGCDAVLVLGPTRAFSAAEASMLGDYVSHGGNLLLALDPLIEHDQVEPSGFEGTLEQFGVRLDADVVLEGSSEHLLGDNMAEFVVTDFNDHTITRNLQGRGRVFTVLSRSVTPTGGNDRVTTLLRTSDKGFGVTNLAALAAGTQPERGPSDIAGPVSLAIAMRVPQIGEAREDDGSSEKTGGRLVVVGDTDFLQGPLLETPELANLDFASAITGYLTQRNALIAIAPKKVKGGALVLSQDDLMALFFRVVVLLPAAALLLGVGVWMSRRS